MKAPGRLNLLSYPLDPVDLQGAADLLSRWMFGEARGAHTVVTLNPEIVVQGQSDEALRRAVRAADLVTADGVGITWAAGRLLGAQVPRAPGFDLATTLMTRHSAALKVYFLGGVPGVAESAARQAAARYGVTVVGAQHGYFTADEERGRAEAARDSGAHLLLLGMGAPRQEIFAQSWRGLLNVPAIMGVGGTLDVLAGTADLAPAWTRRLGVEWVWRVGGNPKRWKRAPRLAQFVRLVLGQGRRA